VYISFNIPHTDKFLIRYFVALVNEIQCFCFFVTNDSKGKAIPLQALTGPEGSGG
jgi:hypothetical protein